MILLKRRTVLSLGTAALLGSIAGISPWHSACAATANTFIWGKSADPVNLDASTIVDADSTPVVSQIFEGLVLFAPGTTDLIPGLAESWTSSPDQLEWTFSLRRGVKFHDGTELNAKAVKFNFDRWSDEANPYRQDAGGTPSVFAYWNTYLKPIFKSIDVVDDHTVVIRLNYAYGPFLRNLALLQFGIGSPDAIMAGPHAFSQKPVGTGPFSFVEWMRDDHITLIANADHWAGKPKLDRLVFKTIKDPTARFLALTSGRIDGSGFLNSDDVASIKSDPSYQVVLTPPANVGFIGMDNSKKPFDDVRVRQAVNMAIDKKALLGGFYAADEATVSTQFIPSGMLGHDDSIEGMPYDPEGAKRLLAEAGFPDGFDTDFWYMPVARVYWPSPKDIAQTIASDLSKVGIRVTLKTEEWAIYLKDINSTKFSMWMLGWTGENGDPDNFYGRWLSENVPNNAMRSYHNEKVQALLKAAAQPSDPNERLKIYMEAQAALLQDVPWVPVVHTRGPCVIKKGIDGFIPNPTANTYSFRNITLS